MKLLVVLIALNALLGQEQMIRFAQTSSMNPALAITPGVVMPATAFTCECVSQGTPTNAPQEPGIYIFGETVDPAGVLGPLGYCTANPRVPKPIFYLGMSTTNINGRITAHVQNVGGTQQHQFCNTGRACQVCWRTLPVANPGDVNYDAQVLESVFLSKWCFPHNSERFGGINGMNGPNIGTICSVVQHEVLADIDASMNNVVRYNTNLTNNFAFVGGACRKRKLRKF